MRHFIVLSTVLAATLGVVGAVGMKAAEPPGWVPGTVAETGPQAEAGGSAPAEAAAPAAPAGAAGTQAGGSIAGLDSAELRPGWVEADGTRMIALDLRLQPGWKTYWRSPGEAGMAPRFDWSGSRNLASATPIWPAPVAFESAGVRSLGFHNRLVLPIRLAPAEAGQPIDVRLALDFGLCRDICVPAHLVLGAPEAGDDPDPAIEDALAEVPAPSDAPMDCTVAAGGDGGLRLTLRVPVPASDAKPDAAPDAAIEITGEGGSAPAWVSDAEVAVADGVLSARADVVPDSEAYVFDPATVRLTLIGTKAAVEFDGCAPDGPDQ